MATLPDDALRRAVEAAAGGGAVADAARARMAVASIPGASVLAELRAVRDLARSADPFPLGDDWAADDWRCGIAERATALAATQESPAWDLSRVLAQVETVAKRRAEAAARALADAEAIEQARHEAAEADRRAAADLARREHNDWTAVAIELGIQNLYRAPDAALARERFNDDLMAAQNEVALVRGEREAARIAAEHRSTQLAVSIGFAGAAFVAAGYTFQRIVERPHEDDDIGRRRYVTEKEFNWGAAFGAGVVGWLVGTFAGPWLVSHAGEIRQGAALVPRLGVR